MSAALAIFYSLFVILTGDVPPAADPPPSRIITIAPNAAEIICELGKCDSIIGVDKFCVHPPELRSRPRVGGLFDPDLEKIVTLRPDLLIIRGRSESLEQFCRDQNINVYHDETERLNDIAATAIELGKRLHKDAEARKIVDEFNARLQTIRDRSASRPRPGVLLTVSRRPDELSNILTAGKNTFLNDMLDVAGGINVFGELDNPWPTVNIESIATRRPRIIIELMPENAPNEAALARLTELWRTSLPASLSPVRVRVIHNENALIPSLRYPTVIDAVYDAIHEEK